MKNLKVYLYIVIAVTLAIALPSCKSKKLLTKPTQPEAVTPPAPVAKPTPPPAPVKQVAPAPPKPNFNFRNIQFDYNSSVLRTDAIQYLDHITAEMKKDLNARFVLKGNASSEGTKVHNMALSVDRANVVKQYLANAGIDVSRLTTKGYGATRPIASNKTEKGKEKNRRVEVKLLP